MPLPRPFGDPFARPDEPAPEDPKPTKKHKLAAPITAGAFSFQLGTPIKRESSSHDHEDGRRWSPMGMPSTPIREMSATPLRQSEKMARPLTSLPSPFGGFKTPAVKLERVDDPVTGTKTKLSELQAPTTGPSAKSLGKRRASEFGLEESTANASAVSPVRPMKALGQLGQVRIGESIHLEEVKKRVEEEGIGVSPRGKKIIKYTGKGPPPLSSTLTNALSAQQSSLVLFYASMQSILYPSRTPKKSRMTPSALTEGALQPLPKCPTALHHLRTAPLVVHVKEVIKGRTGHSIMCRCEVVKGRIDHTDLTSRGNTNEDAHAENGLTSITVILQALPPECTRLGLDPRIMTLKPPTLGSAIAYEIGIWPPWTDTHYDPTMTDGDNDSRRTTDQDRARERNETDPTCHKVVFASRYLLADSSSPH